MRIQPAIFIPFLLVIYTHSINADIGTGPNAARQKESISVKLSQPPRTGSTSSLAATSDNAPLVMYQQALNHLLGRNGAEKSAEKAAELFKTLAEQNWSSAQHMLGNMYLSGKGVEKSDMLAYKWLSLASRNNFQLAEAIQTKRKKLYKKLQSSLSNQTLDKIESSIAEWNPQSTATQLN